MNKFSEAGGRGFFRKMGGGWGEHVASMKGPADLSAHEFRVGDDADFVRSRGVNHRENAVVGADEKVTPGFDQNRAARAADARVDHHNVDRPLGEPLPTLGDDESGFAELVGRNVVGDVDDPGTRSDAQDHAFHRAHEVIGGTEISGESNQPVRHG